MNTSKFPRNRTEDSAPRKNLEKAEKNKQMKKDAPEKGKRDVQTRAQKIVASTKTD